MSFLPAILPFLELAAVGAGAVSLATAVRQVLQTRRTKRDIVRVARGSVALQSSLAEAWADRSISEEEARLLQQRLIDAIDQLKTEDEKDERAMRALVSSFGPSHGQRFYSELAEEALQKKVS